MAAEGNTRRASAATAASTSRSHRTMASKSFMRAVSSDLARGYSEGASSRQMTDQPHYSGARAPAPPAAGPSGADARGGGGGHAPGRPRPARPPVHRAEHGGDARRPHNDRWP